MIDLILSPNQLRKCVTEIFRKMNYPLSKKCDVALDHGNFNGERIFWGWQNGNLNKKVNSKMRGSTLLIS